MSSRYHSLISLFTEYPMGIEVPMLQRDYAQGRHIRINIRNEFLDAIISCLDKTSTNHTLSLDFVYGVEENRKFIPLDGQQRLTTLWLLHFYCHKTEFEKGDLFNKTLLHYKTRKSSEIFISKLVEYGSKLVRNGKLTKQITDFYWYSKTWDHDPTISGMLTMLNSIDTLLSGKNIQYYWNRLVKDEAIRFYLKDLKEHDQIEEDDLYIKMNARGKLLNEFENFKSFIDGVVLEKTNRIFYNRWTSKIDKDWTDLIWDNRNIYDKNPEDIGDEFMRIFRAILLDHLLLKGNESFIKSVPEEIFDNNGHITDETIVSLLEIGSIPEDPKKQKTLLFEKLLSNLTSNKLIYNSIYRKLNLFDKELIQKIYNILNNICEVRKRLKNNQYNQPWSAYLKFTSIETDIKELIGTKKSERIERNILQSILIGDVTYQNRLLFFAFSRLITGNNDEEQIFQKFRIIRNLIHNRAFDNVWDYQKGLQEISKIINYDNVLRNIQTDNTLGFFEKLQIDEEKKKAQLLASPSGIEWSEQIYTAENNLFLLGQIKYLFDFCGVTDFSHPPLEYLTLFIKYFEISKDLFNYTDSQPKSVLVQKALLCFGDYLINFNNTRKGLTNINKDRDTSIKRLLLSQPNNEYFKQLLDNLLSMDNNLSIEERLTTIINREKAYLKAWRQRLVNEDIFFEKIGNYKLLEFKNDVVFMVTGKNNGYYCAEIETFSILHKIKSCTGLLKRYTEKHWIVNYAYTDNTNHPCFVYLNSKDNPSGIQICIHYESYPARLAFRVSVYSTILNAGGKEAVGNYFGSKLDGYQWQSNDDYKYYRFERFFRTPEGAIAAVRYLLLPSIRKFKRRHHFYPQLRPVDLD